MDGQLRRKYVKTKFNPIAYVTSSGLSIDEQFRRLRYSGEVQGESSYGGLTRSASNVNYSASDGLTTFELTDAATEAIYRPWRSLLMNGTVIVRSEITGNRLLRAEVLEEIEVHTPPYVFGDPLTEPFYRSLLELSGSNGSKLVLNADNGDFQSVTIEISTSDGASSTLAQPWSLWGDNLRYERVFCNT